jgi:hypothetical protein
MVSIAQKFLYSPIVRIVFEIYKFFYYPLASAGALNVYANKATTDYRGGKGSHMGTAISCGELRST